MGTWRAAINLKCNPEKAIELREEYDGTVIGGYHSNKKHWNTIFIDKAMEASELKNGSIIVMS